MLFTVDLKSMQRLRKVLSYLIVSRTSAPERIHRALESVQFFMFQMMTGGVGKWDHNMYVMKRHCDIDPRCEVHPTPSSDEVLGIEGLDRPDELDMLNMDEYGLLLYIDNDRASWRHTIQKHYGYNDTHNPLWEVCRFPERLARRFILFAKSHELERSLGQLMRTTTQWVDTIHNPLISPRSQVNIDESVLFIAQIIQRCIDRHGLEKVLIPEPWVDDMV
eukprot:TRINITY_DN2010_c1_g1_i1.p2 TRINITY_DN2010_c1_g1~~TRINITY_DN2010_c1_g1_i1.p2  ORF type:complete len:220 (-),score=71.85 TRINITY_DN2010_c1_g1_i1:347-1006(-)